MIEKLIFLGVTIDGERMEIDLGVEGVRFILLAGMTGSGKSVFHSHLYQELMRVHSPDELGFVFLDMTRSEFADWDARYLARPIVYDADEAFRTLDEIAVSDMGKRMVIHIEECDMVSRDRARMEAVLDKLKEKTDILVVYSTSRIDPDYLTLWIAKYVDMKVVFRVASAADSQFLLGNDDAISFTLPGERVVMYGDQQVKCIPF